VDLLAAWVLFPAILLVGSLGWGVLVERASGLRLPGALLPPVGIAAMIATSRLITSSGGLARFASAVLVVGALAGLALAVPRLGGARLDRWAAIAAVGVFCVAGAPVVLSGSATFAGYNLLPDIAYQMSLGELEAHDGPDWRSLPESSYKTQTAKYIDTAYPVGTQATVGVLARIAPGDVWQLYQAFLSFLLASLALSLYALLAPSVARAWVRGTVAFVAAQPALLVGFAFQGSIKEVSVAAVLALVAVLVTRFVVEGWPPRSLVAVAVAAAAAVAALGPAAGAYLAPMLAVLAVVWLRRLWLAPTKSAIAISAGATALGLVLVLPILTHLSTAYNINSGSLSLSKDLGNLAAPLHFQQVSGIWLNGDYRYLPGQHGYLLLTLTGVVFLAAVIGGLWAIRKGALGPLVFGGSVGLVSVYLLRKGSPYADAKVMAILSSAVLLAAMLGAVALADAGRRFEGVLVGALLAGLVLVSNALAYHDSQLAPYDRYAELSKIDHRLAGKGPTVLGEYDEFGAYFLRRAKGLSQPESGLPFRPGAFDDPQRRPSEKVPIDPDWLSFSFLTATPALVLRHSPTVSRPPSSFRRTFDGRYYEVWQPLPGTKGQVREHLPLGSDLFHPSAVPRCGQVRSVARRARAVGGRLAYVERPPLPVVLPTALVKLKPRPTDARTPGVARIVKVTNAAPKGWFEYAAYPGGLVTTGQGSLDAIVAIPQGGYRLWLEGSFGRRVSVRIDGREVGGVTWEAGNGGQYRPIGSVHLGPGRHRLQIFRGGGGLHPADGGSDGSLRHVGPLVFSSPENEERTVRTVAPARARMLCGRRLDWIEVVAPRA
jgi:hypothetical protein